MAITEPTAPVTGPGVLPGAEPAGTPGLDLDRAWNLDPRVSVRPEPFGALLYHFGTRRLSFLKDPRLRAVVTSLDESASARAACAAAGVAPDELPAFAVALARLADGDMLHAREDPA